MKIRILLSTTCALLALAGASLADETALGKEMSAMNKSLRTIKRQLADPAKKADNLALIEKVKKAIDASHNLDPKKTKDQPDPAVYTKKYKEEMLDLGKAVGELEMAIKTDNQDAAKKALDQIYSLKEKGHKDFGVDDD